MEYFLMGAYYGGERRRFDLVGFSFRIASNFSWMGDESLSSAMSCCCALRGGRACNVMLNVQSNLAWS